MQMNDKQNITIQLAEFPKIPLSINREDEEIYRRAEKLVNDLWVRWRKTAFADESSPKVMARVAFQFAVLFLKGEQTQLKLQELDKQLDAYLQNLPGLE